MRTGRILRAAVAATALLAPVTAGAGARAATPANAVVVQGTRDAASTAAAVRAAGGTVTRDLPLVLGVAADLTTAEVARLSRDPRVRVVTPDSEVRVNAVLADDGTNPTTVKSVYRDEVGATALGGTGRGVRIALIDTGVNEVPDLAGRLVPIQDPGGRGAPVQGAVPCVDLSGEGDCVDRYGHGTFLAGLIAGNGSASGGLYRGVAPGAEIVSVKIAGRNGAADVSKVLAAIQWVVSFRERYGIRVLNLSLGTNSKVSPQYDPLNFAVQQAWRSGIAVVVAAGNSGNAWATISKPGDDPYVITVGAVDDRETPALSDDRLPHFTSRGPVHGWNVKPDVVAPGARLISLRVQDSYIEQHAGPGQFAGTSYSAYRRGSGTSMSTAVASGAVALLLERRPTWSPDRVKYALMSTAHKVAARNPYQIGSGLVQVHAATQAGPGLANQGLTSPGDGSGSIDGSRGDVFVGQCDPSTGQCETCDAEGGCPAITDDTTAQGRRFVADRYSEGNWTEGSWYTSQWAAPLLGTGWYGNSWLGNSWLGNSWLGNSWLGSSWYGEEEESDAYGTPARGGAWYGAWS